MALSEAETAPGQPDVADIALRWLTPENTQIFQGTYSLLHCTVKNDRIYRAVFAVLMFPISHPARFVSLRYTDPDDKVLEIGIIEDLTTFSPQAQDLVRASLGKHYHEQRILRVIKVRCEFSMLFFDIETQRGPESIIVPWRYDRAEDFGEKGKILLDALDNRFVIPDLEDLPPVDRRRFRAYIYW